MEIPAVRNGSQTIEKSLKKKDPPMSETSTLSVGKAAPAFNLPAYPAGKVRLSQFKGEKNVVLYFYPRDDTPGCTTEACGFRDNLPKFEKLDAVILGISGDSVESHEKFGKKFDLPFTLLADEDHTIAEKYGVWVEKNNYGKKSMGIQRATFLIDKKGKLAAIWPKVKVDGHVEEVAEKLGELDA
ncbi:thioredoxin-dependent thiol peroxidase [uncultured Rubinisphaera sp.]|uniref:thioredoxin-dependent thiol peroxidase n=2 Tax=Rubinisphaera TaxID=1649490 RepID=UPI0026D44375|tara:strand:- start:5955 stop:6509 length:555 start_codon:yes stop_codon:yes gene_type:complete